MWTLTTVTLLAIGAIRISDTKSVSSDLLVDDYAVRDWWQNGNFYQIYPRSFKDSDGDGVGDLKGITEKLPYLKEIGVQGVWLSPIFKSPMVDFGYDISDFLAIQPEYGTMADFENLAARCKALGIRLILDFVPNHSSDEHEWFQKSIRRDPEYKDFYIWHPGKVDSVTGKRLPPNNWLSAFRFSAWEWNDIRKEFYLHQYAKQQPDLNYRNPRVVEKMKDTLRFWLGKGASGFRIDTIHTLFEVAADRNGNYPDEPPSGNCRDDPLSHCYLDHIYTANQNETYDMAYQWHDVMEEFKKQHGGDTRILMTEAYTSLENIMRYFGDGRRNGSQIPFNFDLLTKTNANSNGKVFKDLIDDFLRALPKDSKVQPNWVLGNHDQKRIATRLGEARIDLLNILLKTLPGISVTYNGEEIGMKDVIISWEQSVDPQACNTNPTRFNSVSRDPARTPFQWDDTKNAGFSAGNRTWLPISVDYKCVNVKAQQAAEKSHLKVYKTLIGLRQSKALLEGSYEPMLIGGNDVFAYRRQAPGANPIIVVLNLGKEWQTVDLKTAFKVPDRLKIVTVSIQSQYNDGQIVDSNRLTVPNDVGIVLTTV